MLAVATVRTMDDKKQEKVDRFLSHVHGAYKFDEETGETVKLQPVRVEPRLKLALSTYRSPRFVVSVVGASDPTCQPMTTSTRCARTLLQATVSLVGYARRVSTRWAKMKLRRASVFSAFSCSPLSLLLLSRLLGTPKY